MRQLTFRGFLQQYVHALSFAKTNGLYRLAEEAATTNPRLREPLLLYALFSNKHEVLLKATRDKELFSEYKKILEKYDKSTMKQALINSDPVLSDRYLRVYRSYLVVRNKTQNDNHSKLLMRNRILELQAKKNISAYRICVDLKINHGNMSAFMNQSDCSKISLDKARSAIKYLEEYA